VIDLEGVSFSYRDHGDAPPFSLNDINISIPEGCYAAIIGPNGCGKTTVSKIIKGLISPDRGKVRVANRILERGEMSPEVGLVFSNPENQIVSAIVEEDVAFGLENLGMPPAKMKRKVGETLKKFNLTHLAKMLPHHLSGGEQQRLVIAGIYCMGLRVMVLDEATSMLDSRGKRDVLFLIRELNKNENITIVSITHSITEAFLADKIFVMDKGRIVFSGTPKELLFREDIFAGIKADIPEFLLFIKRMSRAGLGFPDGNLGIETVFNILIEKKKERDHE